MQNIKKRDFPLNQEIGTDIVYLNWRRECHHCISLSAKFDAQIFKFLTSLSHSIREIFHTSKIIYVHKHLDIFKIIQYLNCCYNPPRLNRFLLLRYFCCRVGVHKNNETCRFLNEFCFSEGDWGAGAERRGRFLCDS